MKICAAEFYLFCITVLFSLIFRALVLESLTQSITAFARLVRRLLTTKDNPLIVLRDMDSITHCCAILPTPMTTTYPKAIIQSRHKRFFNLCFTNNSRNIINYGNFTSNTNPLVYKDLDMISRFLKIL